MEFQEGVSLSPKKAQEFMELNDNPRSIRPARVKFYARQMKEGKWKNNHPQPLIFNRKGRMVDGQHRCLAVIDSGVTVKVVVASGVSDSVVEALDRGMGRTLPDCTGMNQLEVGAATMILRIVKEDAATAWSPDDVNEVWARFGKQFEKVREKKPPRNRPQISVAPMLVAVLMHLKSGNDLALSQWVAMCKQEPKVFTNSVNSLWKYSGSHKLTGAHTDRCEWLVRAHKAFDPDNFTNGKIPLTDQVKYFEGLRAELLSMMSSTA